MIEELCLSVCPECGCVHDSFYCPDCYFPSEEEVYSWEDYCEANEEEELSY